MKKILAAFLALSMIATSVAIFPLTLSAEDANSTIYVSASGSDSNAGTSDAPVATINKAFELVGNNGTIQIVGTVKPASTAEYSSASHGKTVTVTGGIIDFSSVQIVKLKDNVTFDSITLTFQKYLFAGGYNLTVNQNVTVNGTPTVFGGDYDTSCNSTNVTLLAGAYGTVGGGSRSANQATKGDANIHIGGSATAATVYGGGWGSPVNGNVNIRIDGSANVTTAVYGGGSGGTIGGNTNVTISGNATVYSAFGGGTSECTVTGHTKVEATESADLTYIWGANGTVGKDTHVTVSGANVNNIYGGGSNGGSVGGNTYVSVFGEANDECNTSSHSGDFMIFGGGLGTNIVGSTNVFFGGSAKANYIFGGSQIDTDKGQTESPIGKGANVTVTGGTAFSLYGGSNNVDHGSGATIIMTGGQFEQICGGNQDSNLTGPVTVKLLGGSVTRRVHGGCYNEYNLTNWSSSYYVAGNITLIVGKDMTINTTEAFSAHSRRSSVTKDEIATILFTSEEAYSDHNLGKLDYGYGKGDAYDNMHAHSYTLSNDVITRSCSTCGADATVTLTPDGNVYTGEEIKVTYSYSDNWSFEEFDVTYSNNLNAGDATATFKVYDISIDYNYTIAKLSQKAPDVKVVGGVITGLTEGMEYSVDGKSYEAYTVGANLSGKLFIRYSETENYHRSSAVKVVAGLDIIANQVSGRIGDTVEVFVYAPNYTGGALTLNLEYDNNALTLLEAVNGDVLGGFDGENGDTLVWSAANATGKKGTLVKLLFTINEGASGDCEIGINASDPDIEVNNALISVVPFVYGDVAIGDGASDGKVDALDIIILRNAIASDNGNEASEGADANGDGQIDSRDIILLSQYLANYNYDAGESSVILGGN